MSSGFAPGESNKLVYCNWPGRSSQWHGSEHPGKLYGSCVSKKNTQNRQYQAGIAIFATLSNSELAVPGWDRVRFKAAFPISHVANGLFHAELSAKITHIKK